MFNYTYRLTVIFKICEYNAVPFDNEQIQMRAFSERSVAANYAL